MQKLNDFVSSLRPRELAYNSIELENLIGELEAMEIEADALKKYIIQYQKEYPDLQARITEMEQIAEGHNQNLFELEIASKEVEKDKNSSYLLCKSKFDTDQAFADEVKKFTDQIRKKVYEYQKLFNFRMKLKTTEDGWQMKITKDNNYIILEIDRKELYELVDIYPRPGKFIEIAEQLRRTNDLFALLESCFLFFEKHDQNMKKKKN